MNTKIEKIINGYCVTARPVYKGNFTPDYWACLINQRAQPKRFSSAKDVFIFVEKLAKH